MNNTAVNNPAVNNAAVNLTAADDNQRGNKRNEAQPGFAPEMRSADQWTGFEIQILPAEGDDVLIDTRQALDHLAEIKSREFAVNSPLQACEAQAAGCADRSVGLHGGSGCLCYWLPVLTGCLC
jgi:hypothetical protein